MGQIYYSNVTSVSQLNYQPPANEYWEIIFGRLDLYTSTTSGTRRIAFYVNPPSAPTGTPISIIDTGNITSTSILATALMFPFPNVTASQISTGSINSLSVYGYTKAPVVYPWMQLTLTYVLQSGDSMDIWLVWREYPL